MVSVATHVAVDEELHGRHAAPWRGSELSAAIVTVPGTLPAPGLVTAIVGDVLSTATARVSLLVSPAVSYAVAVSVCGPSPLVVHGTE